MSSRIDKKTMLETGAVAEQAKSREFGVANSQSAIEERNWLMAKLVVDNSSPEALRHRLEAQIQVAFAKLASSMLEYLCGEPETDLFSDMQDFVSIYEAAVVKSVDQVGPDIRIPNLRRDDTNEDEPTNAVLRGALRAVAALLNLQAAVPLDNRGGKKPTRREMKPYVKALEELTSGLAAIQERKDIKGKVKRKSGR